MFVKQLKEKIIPAFKAAHSPGYRALIMVDNSQGHAAYSEDTLLPQCMNLKPGGKQAIMQDGWYIKDGKKVVQLMTFPPDHPEFPGLAKGMREVLMEQGLWRHGLKMECKKAKDTGDKCDPEVTDCCAKHILTLQPDFQAQKSLVQEVIEEAGHQCIFLAKFHCELNFIEFFWGVVKKYLCEHCDYTFQTLKENMPKALASVPVELICKWEHQMIHWMDAY
ncbi:hypothetical protein ARMGADRAFT_1089549 [Armillaria gallica]|uniref:DDE-1 domain-containing protein n=1 Tax=Armillaria gallica TaxID=47427 RepID=A0A2H3D6U8_ARMGA|nr:hypothetical protein ARMGADRAFT_1089549 [Armillaria gallica]